MRLRAGGRSDRGQKRPQNEDAYACRPELRLFVVCDGMGGEAAGEVASRLAVDTILTQVKGAQRELEKAPPRSTDGFMVRSRRLGAAVELSNQAIYRKSQKNPQLARMGTTVVSAWVGDSVASVAHVGDSRAYLWRAPHLEQLTRDHSLVEEQVRAGLLARSESHQAKDQNALLRVLGREAEVEVDLTEVPLRPGDCLLLCTDGLTRVAKDEELADAIRTLREPQKICDHLVELANRNGGPDNITVVTVAVLQKSLWQRFWERVTP